jgi:putative glycosyl hydrolase
VLRRASPYFGVAAVLATALVVGCVAATSTAAPADVVVTVRATAPSGTIAARLGTQFVWPGGLDRAAGTRERFDALAPPLVRINAAPIGGPPVLPAGARQGDWNFGALDSIVNDIRRADAEVLLAAVVPPEWIWTCTTGPVRDPDFGDFGDYMARLVAYYNSGAFVAEDGHTITNPAGVANRIGYWELWNEPDQTKSCPVGGNHLSPRQYVAMWNGTVPKMLAVDPTIKLIGPATAHAVTKEVPDYIPALLAGATRKPDAISFHGYGGWLNSQSDRFLFDGEGSGAGLDGVERGLKRVRALAPEIPVWITELNVNSGWDDGADAHRSWTEFSAAWGASAFRRLALAGADIVLQYQFAHPNHRQFSLVDVATGQPLLPYWRDYYLARYFPPGSAVISSGSNLAGVESLAVRPPGSNDVHLLVVNRQVGDGAVDGRGRPVTVRVDLRNFSGGAAVTARVIDSTTPLDTGPPAVLLPTDEPITVTFAGYGAALLKIAASR